MTTRLEQEIRSQPEVIARLLARETRHVAQIVAQLPLADEFVQGRRPDRCFRSVLLGLLGGDHPRRRIAHRSAP